MPRRDRAAAVDGALDRAQLLDHRLHGLLLSHPVGAHQDLHGLGVGVELALLLRALPFGLRDEGDDRVVTEDVVRELVSDERDQVWRMRGRS